MFFYSDKMFYEHLIKLWWVLHFGDDNFFLISNFFGRTFKDSELLITFTNAS